LNSKPGNFSEFSFEIHSEFEEVPIEKVVPIFKSFTTMSYLKNLELEKVIFGSIKV
jgi:hypothetical protein